MGDGRAIVVDDDGVARALGVAVASQLGFQARGFADPNVALGAVVADPGVRLAMVDWNMAPSGLQLIHALRELGAQRRLCIIVVTGDDRRGEHDAAIAAGAQAVLRKPLGVERLAARLLDLGVGSR